MVAVKMMINIIQFQSNYSYNVLDDLFKNSEGIEFFCVFRVDQYCLINKTSDIFLFNILRLKPFSSILN